MRQAVQPWNSPTGIAHKLLDKTAVCWTAARKADQECIEVSEVSVCSDCHEPVCTVLKQCNNVTGVVENKELLMEWTSKCPCGSPDGELVPPADTLKAGPHAQASLSSGGVG